MSGGTAASGWDGDLGEDLGLSAGVDFTALLGFDGGEGDGDEHAEVGIEDVADLGLDGGAGLYQAGWDAALELLDVGEDLNEG